MREHASLEGSVTLNCSIQRLTGPPISGLPEIGSIMRKSATADLRWPGRCGGRAPQDDDESGLRTTAKVASASSVCPRSLRECV